MPDSVPSLLIACAVGFLSGLHTSTWGMYKDAPHEGFGWLRYFRSAIVGAIMGAIAYLVARPDLRTPSALVGFFGVTYVLERGAIECWKTFLRTEDQSKYFIPMQFAVFGRVIHSQAARLLIGAVITAAVILAFLAVHWMAGSGRLAGSVPAVLAVASIGGWISAFLGAWKDAPIEGFQPLKFVRSPLWAAGYGGVLALFTTSPLVMLMAALGYTIATLETYKTFFFPSKPRDKFAGKPILFPEILVRRQWFVPVYAAIWLLILTGFVLALTGPRRGLITL
jgi:hypothetical protein